MKPEIIAVLARTRAELDEVLAARIPTLSYAFPWPDAVPGLGSRRVGAYTPCADCAGRPRVVLHAVRRDQHGEWAELPYEAPVGTWVRFGTVALCLSCALARDRRRP